MDPVTATFYAVVCGGLAAFAPSFGRRWARALWGILIGVVAATLLPLIRGRFGI